MAWAAPSCTRQRLTHRFGVPLLRRWASESLCRGRDPPAPAPEKDCAWPTGTGQLCRRRAGAGDMEVVVRRRRAKDSRRGNRGAAEGRDAEVGASVAEVGSCNQSGRSRPNGAPPGPAAGFQLGKTRCPHSSTLESDPHHANVPPSRGNSPQHPTPGRRRGVGTVRLARGVKQVERGFSMGDCSSSA